MRKLELRPELFASFASRFLISGFSRMLSVALRVFAINTSYHAAHFGVRRFTLSASREGLDAAFPPKPDLESHCFTNTPGVPYPQLPRTAPTSRRILWQTTLSLE